MCVLLDTENNNKLISIFNNKAFYVKRFYFEDSRALLVVHYWWCLRVFLFRRFFLCRRVFPPIMFTLSLFCGTGGFGGT